MARSRIKSDMMVTVIAGADVGRSGKVLSVKNGSEKVLVEGINMRRKALRRTPDNPQGGIVEQEAPIHISNVMPDDEYKARRRKTGGGQQKEAKQEEGKE